jgi:ATP-dependent DNA helicase RecG
MTEDQLEQEVLSWLVETGYRHVFGYDIAPDSADPWRSDFREVLLLGPLRKAIERLNPQVPLVARLVKQSLLESEGKSRGMVYFLPGESLPTPDQVFVGPTFSSAELGIVGSSSEHLALSSEHLASSSEHLATGTDEVLDSGGRDTLGRMLSAHLDAPIVDDLERLEPGFLAALKAQAEEPCQKAKLGRSRMEGVILRLCQDQFMTLSALSQLVCRSLDGLRQQYLSPMVKAGRIALAFPTTPTHERQAYRAVSGASAHETTDSPGEAK